MTKLVFAATALAMFAATAQAAELARPLPAPGGKVASYCEWVMTFEEGVTERPAWCDDEPTGS